MVINSYSVVESKASLIMFAEVSEVMKNGDVVVVSTCRFYTVNGEDIGFARVTEDGTYRRVSGDYNGRRLLDKFQYVGV